MGDTTLYLDSEYNGHGGELISLALAAEDGVHWYALAPWWFNETETGLEPWVEEHVIPAVSELPRTAAFNDMAEFRASLREYLKHRAPCTIYADWPDDFAHLMRLMSGPAYEQSWLVPCTMILLSESEPKPELPHNALSDAIALMEWHRKKTGHITEDRRHG